MCPIPDTYKIEFVREGHPKRGVAFLVSSNRKVTAKPVFDSLDYNSEATLRTRFDTWVDRLPCKKWYHGWDQSEYKGRYPKCFVFKCKEKRLEHRFYGFLCNPKTFDASYQVCVLVIHARKKGWETDETDLKVVEEIRLTPAVQKSVVDYFKGRS